jgi:hypothetical protein
MIVNKQKKHEVNLLCCDYNKLRDDFRSDLEKCHHWIVESPINNSLSKFYWEEVSLEYSEEFGVTVFSKNKLEGKDAFMSLLHEIVIHHTGDGDEGLPPLQVINIFSCPFFNGEWRKNAGKETGVLLTWSDA